jgi:DNA-binding beta-propeller fold protein YncE
VIDWRTQKTVKRIKAGVGTHNFRALGDKRHVFVSNRTSNEINILDQQTLEMVGSIPVPGGLIAWKSVKMVRPCGRLCAGLKKWRSLIFLPEKSSS